MKWLALSIGIIVTLGVALQFPAQRIFRGQNDFLSLYCGAMLSGTPELRSVDAHKEIAQKSADIWLPSVLFTRPDYYAAILRPLAWMPYQASYVLFQVLSLVALSVFLWLFRHQQDFWMLALCSVPLVAGFANGQDVTFLMLALTGAVILDKKGYAFPAGLLLSVCTIKFHLFIFVPIALIAWRKWHLIAGACTGTACGIAIANLTQPPGWIGRYITLLQSPDINPMPFPLNFHGVAASLGWSMAVERGLIAAVIAVLVFLAWQRLPFPTLLSLCVLGGMLASSHLGMHDYALLLPCCALSRGLLRRGFFALTTPLVYIVMLLPDPWSSFGAAAMAALLALPFIEMHKQTALEIRAVRGLREASF